MQTTTYQGIMNIWTRPKPIKKPEKVRSIYDTILIYLRKGRKDILQLIALMPECKPNRIRNTLYNMLGHNKYKETLGITERGKYFILETSKKQTTRVRVLHELAKGPLKSDDICNRLDDLNRSTVLNMINKLTGKGGYHAKIEHLGDGYYGLILNKIWVEK